MFLVNTENYRLLKTVSVFLQEFGDLSGDELCAVIQNQRAIEVLAVVNTVLNYVSFTVKLSHLRTVTCYIAVNVDLDDFVGRQETVADTLLQ